MALLGYLIALYFAGSSSACPPSPGSSPSSPEPMMEMDPAHTSSSSHAPATRQDKPIFTLKQMTMIAERMCKVPVNNNKIILTIFRAAQIRTWDALCLQDGLSSRFYILTVVMA
jgi:hypothetical protein